MAKSHLPDTDPARNASEMVYEPAAVRRAEHAEGSLTRVIEHQTAKVPSHVFLVASFGAIGLSLYYYTRGKREVSNLIGMWAPTLLTMGVYNKLVKMLKPR